MGKELEKFAELEHDQWIEWAKNLIKNEKLSPERVKRWKKLFVAYDKLKKKDKEDDRIWARKVIKVSDELDELYAAQMIEANRRELLLEITHKEL